MPERKYEIGEFAKILRNKYPEASSKLSDDTVLVGAFLKKNPDYRDYVNFDHTPQYQAREFNRNQWQKEIQKAQQRSQARVQPGENPQPKPEPQPEQPTQATPQADNPLARPVPDTQPIPTLAEMGIEQSQEKRGLGQRVDDWIRGTAKEGDDKQFTGAAVPPRVASQAIEAGTQAGVKSVEEDVVNYAPQTFEGIQDSLGEVKKRIEKAKDGPASPQLSGTRHSPWGLPRHKQGDVLSAGSDEVAGIESAQRNLSYAEQISKQTDRFLDMVGQETYIKNALHGFRQPIWQDMVTMNINAAAREKAVKDILERYDSGKELTPDQEALISAVAVHSQALFEAKTTILGDAAHGLAEMAPYLAWFAATRTPSEAAFQKLASIIGKNVRHKALAGFLKAGGFVVAEGGRFIVNPETYNHFFRETGGSAQMKVDENNVPIPTFDEEGNLQIERIPGRPTSEVWWRSVMIGAAEPIFESSGMHFQKFAGKLATRMAKNNPATRNAFIRALRSISKKNLGKLAEEAGFHGFLVEVLEEEFTAIFQEGVAEGRWDFFTDPRQQATMMLSVAGMSGAFGALRGGTGLAQRGLQEMQIRKETAAIKKKVAESDKALEGLFGDQPDILNEIKIIRESTKPSEQADAIAKLAVKENLTAEQAKEAYLNVLFHTTKRANEAARKADRKVDIDEQLRDTGEEAAQFVDQVKHEDDGRVKSVILDGKFSGEEGFVIKGDPNNSESTLVVKIQKEDGTWETVMASPWDIRRNSYQDNSPEDALAEIMRGESEKAAQAVEAEGVAEGMATQVASEHLVPGTRVRFDGKEGTVIQNLDASGVMVRLDGDDVDSPGINIFPDELGEVEIIGKIEGELEDVPAKKPEEKQQPAQKEEEVVPEQQEGVQEDVQEGAQEGQQEGNQEGNQEGEGFDFGKLFEKDNRSEEEIEAEYQTKVEAEREAAYQESDFDKKWAPTYKEALAKLQKQYADAVAERNDWASRVYKPSDKQVDIQGGKEELDGKSMSAGQINENRRQKAIKRAELTMQESLADMKELGLTQDEIDAFTQDHPRIEEAAAPKEPAKTATGYVSIAGENLNRVESAPTAGMTMFRAKELPDGTMEVVFGPVDGTAKKDAGISPEKYMETAFNKGGVEPFGEGDQVVTHRPAIYRKQGDRWVLEKKGVLEVKGKTPAEAVQQEISRYDGKAEPPAGEKPVADRKGETPPVSETPSVTPEEAPHRPADYGANNKVVTKERYEELKKRMRDKLNNLNVGFDPELLSLGTEMAAYHIEAGARKFRDFANGMINDMGEAIKPYLKSFYNGARDLPGMEDYKAEMDGASYVSDNHIDDLLRVNEVADTPVLGNAGERQQPIENVHLGIETNRAFTTKVSVPGRLAVIELSQLQPSHTISGQRNPLHFIDKAQSKPRTEDKDSANASDNIARNPRWEGLSDKTTNAYHGSPTVNTRGEVIQGNNRSIGLIKYWTYDVNDSKGYRAFLMQKAKEYGLDPAVIANMKQPVLVNMVDVDDAKAVELGQYTVNDLETGAIRRITPQETLRKLPAHKQARLIEIITNDALPDDPIKETVRTNAVAALKYLQSNGAISDTQYKSAFNKDGALTSDAIADLEAILKYNIFVGAEADFERYFDRLAYQTQSILIKTSHLRPDNPANDLRPFIQEATRIINAFNKVSDGGKIMSLAEWWNTVDIYLGARPSEVYSGFSFHLADILLKAKTQKEVVAQIKRYYAEVNGLGGLFPQDPKPINEALKEAFNFEGDVTDDVKRFNNPGRNQGDTPGEAGDVPNDGPDAGGPGIGGSPSGADSPAQGPDSGRDQGPSGQDGGKTPGPKAEYRYHLTLRPYDSFVVPQGNFVRHEDDGSQFGVVVYDRALSRSEMKQFDLAPITDIEQFDGRTFDYYDGLKAQVKVSDNDRGRKAVQVEYFDKDGNSIDEEWINPIEFLKRVEDGEYKPITPVNEDLEKEKIDRNFEKDKEKQNENKSGRVSDQSEKGSGRADRGNSGNQGLDPKAEGRQGDAESRGDQRPGLVWETKEGVPQVKTRLKEGDLALDQAQADGVNLMLGAFLDSKKKAFLLADGTGVGKTRQILALAQEFAKATGKKVLIVTENKQIIENNFADDAKAMGVSMSSFDAGTYYDLSGNKIGKGEYGLVIFDEAHNLKNPDSKKAIAGNKVKADHKVFVTATPMDTPVASAYFISQVTGMSVMEVYHTMGFKMEPVIDPKTQQPTGEYTLTFDKGMNADKIRQNIVAIREKMIKDGVMLRREYPFFGSLQEVNLTINQDQRMEQSEIHEYWDDVLEKAKNENGFVPKPKLISIGGQRSGELSRWNEMNKLQFVFQAAMKDLKAGRKVVIIAEGVNPTEIKGLGRTVPGFIREIKALFEAEGIPVAELYGNADKAKANKAFQEGDIRVVIGTPKSAAAGINLDDTMGDQPRTLYITTANYSGNILDQMLGRVSRRNTKSPAQAIFVYNNSDSDTRRKEIVGGKLATLRAIQHGRIEDPFEIGKIGESREGSDAPVNSPQGPLPSNDKYQFVQISPKAFVVKGDTKPIAGMLGRKGLGGFWMKDYNGWMFPLTRMEEIMNALGMQPLMSVRVPISQQLLYSLDDAPTHPIKPELAGQINALAPEKAKEANRQIGEYDRSLDNLARQAREAQKAHDKKKASMGEAINQGQQDLFGNMDPAEQMATLFEQPGVDISRENVNRILKPLKDYMSQLQSQHKEAMEGRDKFIEKVIKAQNSQTTLEFSQKPKAQTLADKKYEAVKKELDDLAAKTGTTHIVTVVKNIDGLAEAMKENGEPQWAINEFKKISKTSAMVEGLYSPFTGKIYFLTNNIASNPGRIAKVFIHEVGVHYGLTQLIKNPAERQTFLERVYDSVGEAGFRAMFPNQASYNVYKNFTKEQKGNEYLARLSEKMNSGELLSVREKTAWERIKLAFNRILKKLFGKDVKLHDAELREIIRASVGTLVHYNTTHSAKDVQKRAEKTLERRAKNEDAAQEGRPLKSNEVEPGQPTLDFSVSGKEDFIEMRHIPIKKGVLDNLDYYMADVMVGMKKIQNLLEKEFGEKIPDWANAYRAENHYRAKVKYELEQFEGTYGTALLNSVKELTKAGMSEKDIHHYMVAKHAPERNAYYRGRKIMELERKLAKRREAYIAAHPEATQEGLEAMYEVLNQQWDEVTNRAENATTDAEMAAIEKEFDALNKEFRELKEKSLAAQTELAKMDFEGQVAVQKLTEALQKVDFSGISELDKDKLYENPDDFANSLVEKYEKDLDPKLVNDLWSTVKDATDFSLRQSYVSGEISHETYLSLRDMYQNYVPLRGWEENNKTDIFDYEHGESIGDKYNAVLKRAEGRNTMPSHPIPYILNMAHTAIVAKNKNQVKQHALNLARLFPGQNLIYAKRTYLVENDDGTFTEQVERPAQELFDAGKVRRKINNAHERRIPKQLIKEHELYVMEGGERFIIAFSDPTVAQAFFYNPPEGPLRPIGWYTRMLSAWLTSKNPNWIWANQIRDLQFAGISHMINMADHDHFTRNFLGNVRTSSKAIRRAQKGKQDTKNNEVDRYYQEWLAAGGPTGYVHIYSLKRIEKEMRRAAKEAMENKSVSAFKKLLRKEMEITETMAKWSEDTSRFATYLTARQIKDKNGKHKYSVQRAVEISKNADVNYDRKGRLTKYFSSLFAFFNPTIQAMKKTAEFAVNHPKRFTVAMMIFGLRGYFESMLLDMFGDEDEEGVRDYDKINPFLRRFYTMLPLKAITPDWVNLNISIPDPHNWRAFKAIGSIFYDFTSGRIDADDVVTQSLAAFGDAFSPWSLETFVNRKGELSIRPLVPTAFVPFYEWSANESYFGSALRPEAFTLDMERVQPNVTQHWPNVNPVLKNATYSLFQAAGGDLDTGTKYYVENGERKEVPWYADINPAMLEHYLSTLFGARGRWYNQLYKTADGIYETAKNMAVEENPSITAEVNENFSMYDTPILHRFFRAPVSDVVNREYWDAVRNSRDDAMIFKDYLREGNAVKVQEMMMNPRMRESLEVDYTHQQIKGMMETERTLRAVGNDQAADNLRELYRTMQLRIVDKHTRRPKSE